MNNNAASIRARLKNIADKERKPFDFIIKNEHPHYYGLFQRICYR